MMKTRRSIARRFKLTATGKVKYMRTGRSHLLRKKSSKRKRHLRRSAYLSGRDALNVKKMLPYA
ncbi:MAG: 50S ribosomal protein L35 [Synergistetes bacterium]|nr:MAG: 50S ribosomal protein L35 [bacterium 42_11]MBC7332037.1 50S ribosomal protein L35 [Synergistota bacterium]MDK2871075.1 large subunit ribosomal protein [bacterium]